ncbi:hypothetical protein DY000_02057592 [Brassica cretica]|uniref:Uncharacterized protein n=1 Tax=Brassica cretica TaxID=69181 RepID=A0ABQ7A888_BRACR|nr:hypothetical protein DY000_02057592 [Brassica cretica]
MHGLMSYRCSEGFNRYTATELRLEPGCYVATKLWLELGRNVATELRLELGRYVATERDDRSVAILNRAVRATPVCGQINIPVESACAMASISSSSVASSTVPSHFLSPTLWLSF